MATIEIPEDHNIGDLPSVLDEVSRQLQAGNREGYHPRWTVSLRPDEELL